MKKRREKIELQIATIDCEIDGLLTLLETISDIRMRAQIRKKIYALEKERCLYSQLMNL